MENQMASKVQTLNAPPWEGCDPAGPLYRIQDVVEVTGLSRAQTYNLIRIGELPPLLKIGKRASVMPKAWLDAYIRRQAEICLRISKEA
jgi:predicted DNA-binding transcriptional regulator AlpA